MNHPLMIAARKAAQMAYCPYSHFHVGAAVYCDDGTIVQGCNVENASYGLTICAERTAIFSAIAQGKKPVEIAVSCIDSTEEMPDTLKTPCGACRQVIAEFLPDQACVHIDGVGTMTVGELLPIAFRLAL